MGTGRSLSFSEAPEADPLLLEARASRLASRFFGCMLLEARRYKFNE